MDLLMFFGILFGALTKTPGLFKKAKPARKVQKKSFFRRWLW